MTNPNKVKGAFPAGELYRVALQFVLALHVLYSSVMYAKPEKFKPCGFGDFLAVEVPQTKTTMTNTLDIFTNTIKLF